MKRSTAQKQWCVPPKAFMITAMTLALASCQVSFSTILSSSSTASISTTRDGTSWDKYISYLQLNGTQTVQLPLDSSQGIGQSLDYSVMLWFKSPSGNSLGSRYEYVFEFDGSLQCYFTGSNTLMCDSSVQKSDKLEVQTSQIQNNQWTHLAVMGNIKQGTFLQVETNQQVLVIDQQQNYLDLFQDKAPWAVCLGGCKSMYGFIGSFREFKLINQFLTQSQISRIKNHYLLNDKAIIGYYRFTEVDFLKDELKDRIAQIWSNKNMTIVADPTQIVKRDYIPNDICYPITDMKDYSNFSSSNLTGIQILPLTIDNRWQPVSAGWQYSASIWLKINRNTCYTPKPSVAKTNCSILLVQDSFMLYLIDRNTIAAYIFNAQPFYEVQTSTLFVPQNQWVNIQIGLNQYNGYDMRTYDIMGRITGMVSDPNAFRSHKVAQKIVSVLNNYSGLAKSLVLISERVALPMVMPAVDISRGLYYSSINCIAYFMFEPQNFIQVNSTQKLVNYCKPPSYNFLNATVNTNILTFQTTYQQDFAYNQSYNTRGFINASESLFDGIACDDGYKVNQFTSKTSYIKSEFSAVNQSITSMTVEFWFKLSTLLNGLDNSYLFSLWANQSQKEFFGIYYDSITGFITCNPMDDNTTMISFQNYTVRAQFNADSNGWAHLTCSQNSSQVFGHLHMNNVINETQINYQDISQNMPFNNYEIYMGNAHNLISGTVGLRLKDIRVWASMRNIQEIRLWRYREIDPRFVKTPMFAYFRLDEGAADYMNFASINNTQISSKASAWSQIQFVSDPNIVICPLGTFYSSDFTECFSDPITIPMIAVYPIYNVTSDSVNWKFDVSDTQLINLDFAKQIITSWQFEDPILKSIINTNNTSDSLIIPAMAFRENAKYGVKVSLQNADHTFNHLQYVKFVPVSCQYFLVNNQSSELIYLNYTTQQSTENITFTLNLIHLRSYCSEIAFFKDLQASQISYQVVTTQGKALQVNLDIQWDVTLQRYNVTLPMTEQYKLPVLQDVKFIFNFQWENLEHNDLFPSTGLTFQNAKYTINFQNQGYVLIPFLQTDKNQVLFNESVVFNASQSYVTNMNGSNLNFTWFCPSQIASLCLNQTDSSFSIAFSDFISANGTFNESYTFSLIIDWSDNIQQYSKTLTVSVIWYNIIFPNFLLAGPSGGLHLTTASNIFQIILSSLQLPDLNEYNVLWEITPLVKSRAISKNRTIFNVTMGNFLPLTSYNISATLVNRKYQFINMTQTVITIAPLPPNGGQVIIEPKTGLIGITNFTVSIAEWYSSNMPVVYQVWSTSDSAGKNLSSQLSPNWLKDNTSFIFKAVNSNPLQVFIQDQIGEVVQIRIVIKATKTRILDASFLKDTIYHDEGNMRALQDTTQIQTQYNISAQIQNLQMALQNITTLTNDMDRAQLLLDSLQSLNTLTSNSLDNSSAPASYALLQGFLSYLMESSTLQASVLIDTDGSDLILNSGFALDFFTSLGNLMQYTQQNQTALSNVSLNQDVPSMSQDITLIDVLSLKQQCELLLSSQLMPDSLTQTQTTPSFELILEKFSTVPAYTNANKTYYSLNNDSMIFIDLSSLQDSLSNLTKPVDSFCIISTFYRINFIMNETITPIQQLSMTFSHSYIDFGMINPPSFDLRPFVKYYYTVHQIDNSSSINSTNLLQDQNVVLCMASQGDENWNSDMCQTTQLSSLVQCDCSSIGNLVQGVFLVSPVINQLISVSVYVHQPFIAIAFTIALLAIGLPILGYRLDKRDKIIAESLEMQFTSDLKLAHAKIQQQVSLSYWFINYPYYSQMQNNVISFSLIFKLSHPLLAMLTRFEDYPRFYRIMPWLAQAQIYTIVIIVMAQSWFTNSDSYDDVLVYDQVVFFIKTGVVGMCTLLPIPFLRQIIINKSTAPESQKIDVMQVTPASSESMSGKEEAMQNELSYKHDQKRSKHMIAKLLALITFGLSIAAFVLSITLLRQSSLAVQYCTVGAFFLGIFGSFLITHVIYAFWQFGLYSDHKSTGIFVDQQICEQIYEQNIVSKACQKCMMTMISNHRQSSSPNNTPSKVSIPRLQFESMIKAKVLKEIDGGLSRQQSDSELEESQHATSYSLQSKKQNNQYLTQQKQSNQQFSPLKKVTLQQNVSVDDDELHAHFESGGEDNNQSKINNRISPTFKQLEVMKEYSPVRRTQKDDQKEDDQ